MKIQIKSIFGKLLFEFDGNSIRDAVLTALKNKADLRDANLCGADLCGANLRDADLCGADLYGANLCDADLRGADLRGANLCSANLCDADLRGANLRGLKIKSARVFSGLYRYQVFSILDAKGVRHVKMGCLLYSLEEWDKMGILNSNPNEFPNDGSRKSKERAEAFEFAKNAALNLE